MSDIERRMSGILAVLLLLLLNVAPVQAADEAEDWAQTIALEPLGGMSELPQHSGQREGRSAC